MKYLFIVQGEGRGHLTQSVTLAEMLTAEGHTIERVFVGCSPQRMVPDFYKRHFRAKLTSYRSPNFVRTKDKKGISVGASLLVNLFFAPLYLVSVFRLARAIRKSNAETVINFYDMTGSIAHFFACTRKRLIVISHHFYFELPGFEWPSGYRWMRFLMHVHSKIVSAGASVVVALSFSSVHKPRQKQIVPAPPLIRKSVKEVSRVTGKYYLVYLLNEGFLDEVYEAAEGRPESEWHVYSGATDHRIAGLSNVKLSGICGDAFIQDLAGCREVISTAGFETVCEAAYLGKPIRVIPSKGHFEQLCNALDAERSGLARKICSGEFIEQYSGPDRDRLDEFREWCDQAHDFFVALLCG